MSRAWYRGVFVLALVVSYTAGSYGTRTTSYLVGYLLGSFVTWAILTRRR